MVIPMSERDTDFSAGTEITDTSRSTAEFRAFASQPGNEAEQQPWSMRAPGRKVALLAGIIVAIAIVLAVLALTVLNA
jgi:hypothetical protein